jgi:hypothetical protein
MTPEEERLNTYWADPYRVRVEQLPPILVGFPCAGKPSGLRCVHGVRVTHLPSGVTATVELYHSKKRNYAVAMEMIRGAICCDDYPR